MGIINPTAEAQAGGRPAAAWQGNVVSLQAMPQCGYDGNNSILQDGFEPSLELFPVCGSGLTQ